MAAATILTRTLSDTVSGDNVSLTGGTASFADKNVSGRTVTGGTFSLTGTDAGNYYLNSSTLTTTADITQKTVWQPFHGCQQGVRRWHGCGDPHEHVDGGHLG